MAVLLDPSKALYSSKSSSSSNGTVNEGGNKKKSNNSDYIASLYSSNSYADSPSRQVRRSTRVASLSPSSFTPLIPQMSLDNSEIIPSSASSTSSYMPSSPSRKYSLKRNGYQGAVMDEIKISDIEPENKNKNSNFIEESGLTDSKNYSQNYTSSSGSSYTLSNPERIHPTLTFQPTNLSTPSTLLSNPIMSSSSGITPSVKHINLQETPTQRILEKLVTKGDMEEIAKATPLGNKGPYKPKYPSESQQQRPSSLQTQPTSQTFPNNLSRVQIINNNNNKVNNPYSQPQMPSRTPQKQVEQSNSNVQDNSNSDETVKVVRTLRNRSIVASPIPPRRYSVSHSHKPDSSPLSSSAAIGISVIFKRHQKNLLAYSLVTLFFLATLYHIYDGLNRPYIENVDVDVGVGVGVDSISNNNNGNVVNETLDDISKLSIEKDEIIKIVSQISKEEILPSLQSTLQDIETRLQAKLEESLQTALNQKLRDTTKESEVLERISLNVEQKFREIDDKMKKIEKREIEKEKERENSERERLSSKITLEKIAVENTKTDLDRIGEKEEHNTPPVLLKIVKHLSTSPLSSSSLFRKSDFSPENAIINDSSCFRFRGTRGKISFALPPNISKFPSHVIIKQPLLADRSCTPRDIEIWGLPNPLNERDSPLLLAKGSFDLSLPETEQSFKLKLKVSPEKIKVLQLRIRNNHGNDQFTCLHLFKVVAV